MSEPVNISNQFINPGGIIEVRATGPSTPEAVNKNATAVLELIKKQLAKDLPILILIDSVGNTSHTEASRRALLDAMLSVPHTRIAFYAHESRQLFINTLAMVADKSDTIKAFNNRNEAVKWLRS